MKIAISTESTVDLPKDIIEKYNIFVIPFNVILGDKEQKDDENLKAQDLYDFVSKNNILPKTAAVSNFEFQEYFQSIFAKGYDEIIHFSLSSALSSSCANAINVAGKMRKVHVIDTKSLSTGIALLVLSAADKVANNQPVEQILSEAKQETNRVRASFVINNLRYLYKGGRCSSLALLGANILKIKPQILLVDGKMQVGKKYRGKYDEVLVSYVGDVLGANNPDKNRVFVTSSSKIEFEDSVVKMLKDFGFIDIIKTQAGATICSHCGPETIGVLFLNKE